MKAKILAFELIALLILGAFRLKIIATEYFLKVTDAETQKQIMQDCSNLPSAISEDIKDCEEAIRNDGAKRNWLPTMVTGILLSRASALRKTGHLLGANSRRRSRSWPKLPATLSCWLGYSFHRAFNRRSRYL